MSNARWMNLEGVISCGKAVPALRLSESSFASWVFNSAKATSIGESISSQ